MTFADAKIYTMPFGKYRGQALDEIAGTDEGLEYLDRLRGERQNKHTDLDEALAAYLDDPAIAAEVKKG